MHKLRQGSKVKTKPADIDVAVCEVVTGNVQARIITHVHSLNISMYISI